MILWINLGMTDDDFCRIENLANPSLDVESALLVDKWQNQSLTEDRLSHCMDVVRSLVASQGGGTKYFLDRQAVAAIRKAAKRSNMLLARDFLAKADASFSLDNPCSRVDALDVIEQRMALLEREVNRHDAYPSMRPTKADESIHTQLRLDEGWRETEHKSVHSSGAESRIRFRMFRRRLYHAASGIRILLRGQYLYGQHQTAIEINGLDYGTYNLEESPPGLDLPFDELGMCDTVDIVLRHGLASPCDGPSIFELKQISFYPIPSLAPASK